MKLNIATYNIQHCRDYVLTKQSESEIIDVEKFAETIKGLGADICGLNEVYNKEMLEGGTNQAKVIAESLGFHYCFAKAIDYKGFEYGNALVSRFPIISMKTFPIILPENMKKKERYENRILLVAKLDVNGTILTVMVCHFGLSQEEKDLATDIVLREIKNTDAPLVFMGDLNSRPETEVIARLRAKLCDITYLLDCEKPTHDSVAPYTKIDYIFTDESIGIIEADTPSVICSDHLPVTAKIEI